MVIMYRVYLQCVGMACRVSCATPVLGPGMGVIGVGIASAMAGQAGLHCRHHFQTGQHPLRLPPSVAFCRQDLLLDACLGITLYKVHIMILSPSNHSKSMLAPTDQCLYLLPCAL